MKKVVINKTGDWGYWSEKKKNELKLGFDNTEVGSTLLYENDKFKVWSIVVPPNTGLPFHKHSKSYFWTAINKGNARSHFNDGTVIEVEYDKGDLAYFDDLNEDNYFVHDLENIGDTTLEFTTVEFK